MKPGEPGAQLSFSYLKKDWRQSKMNVMEQLLGDINKLTADPGAGQLTYYCCEGCGSTYGTNSGPKSKCECGSEGFQYPGATKDEARQRREQATTGVASTADTPNKADSPAVEVANEPAPRKPRVRKEKEQAPPPPAPTVSHEAPDFKAEREAAIKALIDRLKLNEVQPVEVGTALVQAVGFTLWIRDERGARPVYRVQESFESAADFRAAYDAARASQPALKIDCAACSHVSSPEVEKCLFGGDLIASLNTGHGTMRVKAGQRVKIGCYKTKENKLRFAVIE